MSGRKTREDGPPQSSSRSKRQNKNGTQPAPASSRTKRAPGWRSQTPDKTTALMSSAIRPMGKLATVIRDWFRGSRPETPTPIWRDPPRGFACKLIGRLVCAADRKSTRLNSSHGYISYAVFCLKKKKLRRPEPCALYGAHE